MKVVLVALMLKCYYFVICHIDTGIYLPGVYDFLQFTRRSSNPLWNSTCGASSHWSRLTFQFLLKLIIVFLEGNIELSSNHVRGFSTELSAFQKKNGWIKWFSLDRWTWGFRNLSHPCQKTVCFATKRGDLCC